MKPAASLVTPERYLEYLRDQGISAGALAVAPAVLVGWGPLGRELAVSAGARRRPSWPYDAQWPYHDATSLGVLQLPTGAPAAAFLLDQLIACGARLLVTVGIAGSLVPEAPPGTIVVVDEALGWDGTSPHYSSPERTTISGAPALAGELAAALAETGRDVRRGTAWTTDAPFREVAETVVSAREAGALAVDMETAAVYALAAFRGAAACSVLVLTDCVWDEWRPAYDAPAVRQALDAVIGTLPEAVAGLEP